MSLLFSPVVTVSCEELDVVLLPLFEAIMTMKYLDIAFSPEMVHWV